MTINHLKFFLFLFYYILTDTDHSITYRITPLNGKNIKHFHNNNRGILSIVAVRSPSPIVENLLNLI